MTAGLTLPPLQLLSNSTFVISCKSRSTDRPPDRRTTDCLQPRIMFFSYSPLERLITNRTLAIGFSAAPSSSLNNNFFSLFIGKVADLHTYLRHLFSLPISCFLVPCPSGFTLLVLAAAVELTDIRRRGVCEGTGEQLCRHCICEGQLV